MEALLMNPYVVASLALTAIALGGSSLHPSRPRLSGRWAGVALVPGLVALIAFYSLALRMHAKLGGWPGSIGMDQLPPELRTHAEVSLSLFTWVLVMALVMPAVLALFAAVPKLRARMAYPALCGVACWVGLLLTYCAPAGYLDWWWD